MTAQIYGRSTGNMPRQNATGDIVPKGFQKGQLNQFTPEQMQLFQSLFSQVGPESFLGKLAGGDQSQFGEVEAPALRQFGEIQGGLASRFSGMGLGGRKSSGFQNTMNQAASDFAQKLQGNRQNTQRQALMDLLGISNSLLGQRPYDKFLVAPEDEKSSFWEKLLGGGVGGLLGGLGGFASGGWPGAGIGAAGGFAKGYNF